MCIQYLLRVRWHKQSLISLGITLGLYILDQTRVDLFDIYMSMWEFWFTRETNRRGIWNELRVGDYRKSNTKVTNIRDPDHSVLHRMILNTVHQWISSHEKVNETDRWILNQIVGKHKFTNITFVIAKMFVFAEAKGFRTTNGLMTRNYITRLACSHNILSQRVVSSLTPVGEMGFIDVNQVKGKRVLMKHRAWDNFIFVLNRRLLAADAEEEMPQQPPQDEGVSGSHQLPPTWDPYTVYQGLSSQFHQFAIDQAGI